MTSSYHFIVLNIVLPQRKSYTPFTKTTVFVIRGNDCCAKFAAGRSG